MLRRWHAFRDWLAFRYWLAFRAPEAFEFRAVVAAAAVVLIGVAVCLGIVLIPEPEYEGQVSAPAQHPASSTTTSTTTSTTSPVQPPTSTRSAEPDQSDGLDQARGSHADDAGVRPRRFVNRALRSGLTAALGMFAIALLAAAPVGAHSDTGNLSLEVVGRSPLTLDVRVALSYTSDGHPAEGATVTVTATSPGGATAGPVTLAAIGLGGYRGEVSVPTPGSWTVRAEAVDPAATAEAAVDVAPSAEPDASDGEDPDEPPSDVADGADGPTGPTGPTRRTTTAVPPRRRGSSASSRWRWSVARARGRLRAVVAERAPNAVRRPGAITVRPRAGVDGYRQPRTRTGRVAGRRGRSGAPRPGARAVGRRLRRAVRVRVRTAQLVRLLRATRPST